VTAGSDCGICVVSYDSENTYACLERQLGHKDYVKKVLWRSGNIISAGLDGQVLIQNFDTDKGWIINWCAQKKHSIYALDANAFGTLIASAGADPVVRVYDIRTPLKEGKRKPSCKLEEHKDTVKSLCLVEDYTLLSGGADNSILLWDFRSPLTPVRTFNLHEDSIWHISPATASSVYTASRDGDVFQLDYKTGQAQRLVHDSDPISSVLKLPAADGRLVTASSMGTVKIWNANSDADSTFVRWKGKQQGIQAFKSYQASTEPVPKEISVLRQDEDVRPDSAAESPAFVLPRVPSIVKTQILPNRLQILTLDSNGNVDMWDIFKVRLSSRFRLPVPCLTGHFCF
jgi:WD40 repeat protein